MVCEPTASQFTQEGAHLISQGKINKLHSCQPATSLDEFYQNEFGAIKGLVNNQQNIGDTTGDCSKSSHINNSNIPQNCTKSSTAIGNVANLIVKDVSMNHTTSQLMVPRGSVQHQAHNNNAILSQNSQRCPGSIPTGSSCKQSKAQLYEKMLFQQQSAHDKKAGLFPRISNLRNEVTVLFKNSNSNPGSSKVSVIHQKPMSSPRQVQRNTYNSENTGQRALLEKNHNGQYYSQTPSQSIVE